MKLKKRCRWLLVILNVERCGATVVGSAAGITHTLHHGQLNIRERESNLHLANTIDS